MSKQTQLGSSREPIFGRRRDRAAGGRGTVLDQGGEWARGVRGPGDLIAPDYVRVTPAWGQIGRMYYTVLHVAALDPETGIGFLNDLLRGGKPVDLAWHLRPLSRPEAKARLDRGASISGSEASASMAEGGLIDPAAQRAAEDMEALRHLVEAGEEKIWRAGIYILVRGETLRDLTAAVDEVYARLGSGAQARIAYELQWHGLEAFTPSGQDLLNLPILTDTSAVCRAWPLGATSLRRPTGIFWGHDYDSGAPVIFDLFDRSLLANSNSVVCAPSGKGKSFFVKRVILALLQEDIHAIVIDPKGEYRWVCDWLGPEVAEYIALAPSSVQGLNLFELPTGDSSRRDEEYRFPVQSRVAALKAQFSQMLGGIDREHSTVLGVGLLRSYQEVSGLAADATNVPRQTTWPRMGDLVRVLQDLPTADDPEGHGRRLALMLRDFAAGGTLGGIYDPERAVSYGGKRLTVFGINAVPEGDQPGVTLMLSDYVTSKAFGGGGKQRYFLVVDEAHKILKGPGADILSNIGRVARSLGFAVCFISQLVEDFVGTVQVPLLQGQAIFENSSIHVYLPQAVGNPDVLPAVVGLRREQLEFLGRGDTGDILIEVEKRFFRLRTRLPAHTLEYKICTSEPRDIERFRQEMGRP